MEVDNRCVLPTKMTDEDRRTLEAAGVNFSGANADNPKLQYWELPGGWTRTEVREKIHHTVRDKNGRERFQVRITNDGEHVSYIVLNRFDVFTRECELSDEWCEVVVTDDGVVIRKITCTNPGDIFKAGFKLTAWLEERYPEWAKPEKYWEETNSGQLPTNIPDDARETMKAMGVRFLEVLEDKPHFRHVELPTGWTLEESTGKSAKSKELHLRDENGRRRASVYSCDENGNAAVIFYARYNVVTVEPLEKDGQKISVAVTDAGVPFLTVECTGSTRFLKWIRAIEILQYRLSEDFPRWKESQAYWSEVEI
jgi:hypothetical protein